MFTLRRPADIGAETPRGQLDKRCRVPDRSEAWRFRFQSPWHLNCMEALRLDKIAQGDVWLGKKGRLCDMVTFSSQREEENSQETDVVASEAGEKAGESKRREHFGKEGVWDAAEGWWKEDQENALQA